MGQHAIVTHVDATFGGKPVRFELQRDHQTVDLLEKLVGSVSACWGRFRNGDWTVTDVREILTLAHPPANPRGLTPLPGAVPHHGTDIRDIDRQMASRPLATYAALAGAILSAAFIGRLDDGSRFDEDAPLVAKPSAEEAA